MLRTFGSDNFAGVHSNVIKYLQTINNEGHMTGYGNDKITQQAQKLFEKIFGDNTDVLFVPTGTGANILSLKLLLEKPYEALITSEVSHIFEEETGAAAATIGRHTFTLPHTSGKIDLARLEHEVALRRNLGLHSALPRAVSIASTTEYGTYYSVNEVQSIADFCHENNMYLHMDGCRLPNALAAIGCSLREYTRDAGVDVLSFGGAKNGLMNAEAVVIFRAPESDWGRMQKQSLQLTSKMRFVSGQFIPYFKQNLWLKNAQHSNELAKVLAQGLKETLGSNVIFTQPIETNQVFCILPDEITKHLRQAGHLFYDWNTPGEVRFVTSWDNTAEDIVQLIELIKKRVKIA